MRKPGVSLGSVRARSSGFKSDRDPASDDVTYCHCSGILRLQARPAFSREADRREGRSSQTIRRVKNPRGLLRLSRNLGLPGFDKGRGKSSERIIELRAALGYVVLMTAKIYSLSREVREAALDLKAIQRRIRDAGHRAYEW